MRKLIIADVKSNNNKGKSVGHYFSIAQNFLDLYGRTIPTLVAGGPVFNQRFTDSEMFHLPFDSITGKTSLQNKRKTLLNCRYLFRKTNKEDVIVFQHSGAVTTFLGIALFARKQNNVYVIQYDTDALSNPLKRLIFKFAKKKIKGILCPNERIGDAYGINYCCVTDYIYPNFDKQMEFRLLKDKPYDFSIVGSISPDKGTVEAARALSKTNFKVLIAGKANQEESELLIAISKKAANIELHLGYVSDEDYKKYISLAKYSILNYKGVYSERSSGVVLDILFSGIPVVGRKCNALSFIEKEKVGMLYDDISHFDFSSVLNESTYKERQVKLSQFLTKQEKYWNKVVNFLEI